MAIYTPFASATLYATITAASTSLTVYTGQGARFGTGQWYGIIWDTYYRNPAEAYQAGCAEIVLATSDTTDTITITRAQESTSARAFNRAGRIYQIYCGVVGTNLSATSAHLEAKVGNCIDGSNEVTWTTAFANTNYACQIRLKASNGDWMIASDVVKATDKVTFTAPGAGTYDISAHA